MKRRRKAVQAAHDVYLEFRHSSVEERKQLLDRIVEEYKNRKQDIIEAITAELGAPLTVSENFIIKWVYNTFQKHVEL